MVFAFAAICVFEAGAAFNGQNSTLCRAILVLALFQLIATVAFCSINWARNQMQRNAEELPDTND